MGELFSSREPVRIGVLFSPTSLFRDFETAFMQGTIAGIMSVNRSGGIAGRPIEPVFYDPQSDPSRYPGLVSRLVLEDDVSHIFGCMTSPTRKAAMPVVERLGALLWYPNQYEGFEISPNIVYGGPCPNQYNVPLIEYIRETGRRRVFMAGSDYSFPHECLRIFRELAEGLGVEIVGETYIPLSAPDDAYFRMVRDARSEGADIVVSAVVYPGLQKLFRAFRASALNAIDMPLANVAGSDLDFSVADTECVSGHIAVGSYFAGADGAGSGSFINDLQALYGQRARANMHTLASYNQIRLFARTLEASGSLDLDAMRDALPNVSIDSIEGKVSVDSTYQCILSCPRIGVANDRGRYDVVRSTSTAVAPDPYMVAYA